MMSTKKVRLGSISILAAVILLCITVLAILSLATVRAEDKLSTRFGQTTSDYYDLHNEGQQFLREVAEALQTGETAGGETASAGNGQGSSGASTEPVEMTLLLRAVQSAATGHESATVTQTESAIEIRLYSEERELCIVLSPAGGGYQVENFRETVLWTEDESLNVFH